jgi:hypothetical protein
LDTWTPDRDNAHDFGLINRAAKFAKKIGLPDLELIVSVDDPQKLSNAPLGAFLRNLLRPKHS